MSLETYLTNAVANVRKEYRYTTIQAWQKTLVDDPNDYYGSVLSITSGSRCFSGAIGWQSTIQRQNTAGGYYPKGEIRIGASLTEKDKDGINLENENLYLVTEGVNLKIVRIVETKETEEMVIYCEKMNT